MKNSIQHPKRELNYGRRVGSFGKWHECGNGGGTDGLRRVDRFAAADAILKPLSCRFQAYLLAEHMNAGLSPVVFTPTPIGHA